MVEPAKNPNLNSKESKSFSNAPQIGKNQATKNSLKKTRPKSQTGIPKPVANRMARRIAFTTGLPTFSGMAVFIGSYILVSRGIMDIAPGVTLLSSAGCFLLGLLGLSYGILSASWDKSTGSLLGIENIRTNFVRIKSAFRNKDDEN